MGESKYKKPLLMGSKQAGRRKARRFALQAIYQWQSNQDQDAVDIMDQFIAREDTNKADMPYFGDLLNGIIDNIVELDDLFSPLLDRKKSSLSKVELAVLRLASYEFKHQLDVPYKVVINEALELSKTFGATDGYKYVNGVLDKLAKTIRIDAKKASS